MKAASFCKLSSQVLIDTHTGSYPNNDTNNREQNSENNTNTSWVDDLPLQECSNSDTEVEELKDKVQEEHEWQEGNWEEQEGKEGNEEEEEGRRYFMLTNTL